MRFLNRLLFLIGWLLSPLTTWNDVFINIPLAYICASLFFKIAPVNFPLQVIIFYWLSNALGIMLMYATGRNVIREKTFSFKNVLVTLLIYSIILFLLDKFVALRPI